MREPGEKVGPYVLRALIGRGGMGEVYEAEDTRLGRRVALKLISVGADPDASERMMREARAAAAFEHPNVVLVFDVGVIGAGEDQGQTYLAMELVRGRTFRALIHDASVPRSRKLRWLVDVARALAAGHAAGLVHRDIKPDNLMVRDDGVVKVLDFGIAKRSHPLDPSAPTESVGSNDTLTKAGTIVGTPRYASPEQLRSEPLDGRADQYSWAVTGFELLTGRVPFEGDDLVALLGRVLSVDPPKLRAIDPAIEASVEATILKAMAKTPGERLATLDDAADALEPYADAVSASDRSAMLRGADGAAPGRSKRPAAVVTRAAKTSARIFFWVAAAVGTMLIAGVIVGAVTGTLRVDGVAGGKTGASSAAATTMPEAELLCSDAKVSGPGATPELAHMMGIGACAHLAIATGRGWRHERGVDVGAEAAKSTPLDVEVAFGETTHVNLKVGAFEASADSPSPVEAVQKAAGALAPRIGAPPMSAAQRAEWGTQDEAGARRIERVWRALLVDNLKDPLNAARELVKTDGDSPWPHAIVGALSLPGSKVRIDALSEAEGRLDKLSGARRKALGAIVGFLSKPDPEQAIRDLRQAYDDAPDDADMAGMYAAIAIDLVPTEEGFAVVDRLAARFPTRAILALQNAAESAPRLDVDRNERYLRRLIEIVPDATCGSLATKHRARRGDLETARSVLATCKRYYGSAADEFYLDLEEARLDLATGQPDKAHDRAARRLGDPQPAIRASAANIVIGSYLVAGRAAEAEEMMLAELRRSRDEESTQMAMLHAQGILRLHRRLGTRAPLDVVSWLDKALAQSTSLPKDGKLELAVEVALARSDGAAADQLLKELDTLGDPNAALTTLPLLRVRRGDRAAVDRLRSVARPNDRPRAMSAIDGSLALLAVKAPPAEVERALAPLRDPSFFGALAIDRIVADILLARAYESAGRHEDAAAASTRVDRALTRADAGLRGALEKLR